MQLDPILSGRVVRVDATEFHLSLERISKPKSGANITFGVRVTNITSLWRSDAVAAGWGFFALRIARFRNPHGPLRA